MKCKFCGAGGLTPIYFSVCIHCMANIVDAAVADGYTVADGVVMKPCDGCCKCANLPERNGCYHIQPSGICTDYCHGTGRVKAGGEK